MSWLFSRVLVEEYLGENSLDGEQSVPLNGKPTPQAYLSHDKMTDFSKVSRFGMTFAALTESRGEALLMLYREGFLAKTLAQGEKVKALTENEAECGEKWHGSFTKYDPDSSLWKTHQCSLLGDLEEFSETWPQWGLMRNGECWELRTLAQTIRGTESGLLPDGVATFHTPNTTGLDGGSNSRKALKKRTEKMWPTPTVACVEGGQQSDRVEKTKTGGYILRKLNKPNMTYGAKLSDAILYEEKKKWPTPVTRDYKDSGSQESLIRARDKRDSPGLGLLVGAEGGGTLNPMWVEWLMGWPQGWTELKPSETDKSPSVQLPLGES
jgi:DNA (cytosine-5)-methyltransferase 1